MVRTSPIRRYAQPDELIAAIDAAIIQSADVLAETLRPKPIAPPRT